MSMSFAGPDVYAHVDDHLRGLAGAAEGFGRHCIGGRDGPVFTITSLADSGRGTLREACAVDGPLWIVFAVSGRISLSSGLKVKSYKTIDGRGQRVQITGNGLQLRGSFHVIVCNLEFEGGRGHDVDAIQLKPAAQFVWIDRCSLADYDDGLIDITRASTDVTVSRCHFQRHNKTMLIGADPKHTEDRAIRVTIHRCFFDSTQQRHPRVRFGKVHVYNNYTLHWGLYAVGIGVEAQVVSECNVYEAGEKNRTKVFQYYPEKAGDREGEAVAGSVRSTGDFFLNGAKAEDVRGESEVFQPSDFYSTASILPASAALADLIRQTSGWQAVELPQDSA